MLLFSNLQRYNFFSDNFEILVIILKFVCKDVVMRLLLDEKEIDFGSMGLKLERI
jgi:hypothetical protein